jgi:hypothetical protein
MNEIKDSSFFSAGKAIFTVKNPAGTHYTFQIRKKEFPKQVRNHASYSLDQKVCFFVSLLTGPDNISSFTYLGLFHQDTNAVVLTKKSKYADDSTPVKVVRWAIKKICMSEPIPAGYSIQHEGQCCRCGRRLTTPESIDAGIGPECAGRAERTNKYQKIFA